ncbi:Hypothetical protein FKW44_022143 [Caligus rogercresseyi]|uniref:Uncharacterized protein n=1 Tax=Caligus rogercresseyi TaxID=217165 RepID=A0A7T8GSD0_CALRO|nr:Hypothetical protein FKW44_022143 [Caligus rogercresseyi]
MWAECTLMELEESEEISGNYGRRNSPHYSLKPLGLWLCSQMFDFGTRPSYMDSPKAGVTNTSPAGAMAPS